MTTAVQTRAPSQLDTLRDMLDKSKSRLAEVAPKHLKVERLVRILLSAASRDPKILACTKESVLLFCMKCSETGLEPIGAGGAWPIPYGTVLTFIPDYRGLVNCAKRAECIKDAYAEVVREADEFDYELGMNPSLTHKPARVDRGELQAAYCIITFPDGTKRFVVMDGDEVRGIKNRSKAASSGPWKTDESEMWKKTVVRRAMKPFAGASPELDIAIKADDEATGINFTPPAPIAMPKAIEAESTTAPEKEKADDLPMGDAAGAGNPSEPTVEEMRELAVALETSLNNAKGPISRARKKANVPTEGMVTDRAVLIAYIDSLREEGAKG